jgi:hypothetical protein
VEIVIVNGYRVTIVWSDVWSDEKVSEIVARVLQH